MIQSKPFMPSFSLGPGSPSAQSSDQATSLMSSLSLNNSSNEPARRPAQPTAFSRPNGSVFSPHNSNDGDLSAPPSFIALSGTQSDTSDIPSTSSSGNPRSGTSSSFFPSSSFQFSVNPHSSINSISHTSASTNSITSSLPPTSYAKNPSISSISNSHGLPPAGTSNFFPSSVEDPSNFTPLRVSNLPRDIKEQEFNVLFTFAPEFVFSEIQKAQSIGEDGLPTSVIGIGYFKSLPAAANAMTVLTSNPHVFAPKDLVAQSGNLSPSPYAIKCEIPYYQDPTHISGFPNQQSQPANAQHAQSGPFKSSRFIFPTAGSTAGGLANPQLDITPSNFPDIYSDGGLNGGVFFPTTGGSHFPGTTDSDYITRMTGKSLLLESQGKEDEEYNDLVKDPMGWLSRNESGYPVSASKPSGPVGFASLQTQSTSTPSGSQLRQSRPQQTSSVPHTVSKSQQGSQTNSRAQSPPSSSNSSSSLNTAAGKAPGRPSSSSTSGINQNSPSNSTTPTNAWADKRRNSTARSFQNLAISNAPPSSDGSKVVVPYSPTNNGAAMHVLQNGGRVLPPANPADQNPPCNTLYVGNLPPDTSEEELKELFSSRRGYKRLLYRTKANGPMCFVEFEDVSFATRALEELYGFGLSNSVKGGIRLSFSKNPLGVRSQANSSGGANSNTGSGNNGSNSSSQSHSHARIGSQQMPMVGVSGYSNSARVGTYNDAAAAHHQQRQQQQQTQLNYESSQSASGYMSNQQQQQNK